jgi:hypothetical protein
LFYSGNNISVPRFFDAFDDFTGLLRTKNYRGALSLRRVKLDCLDNGKFRVSSIPLEIRRQEYVGYTPYRVLPFRSALVLHYAKGHGDCIEPHVVATRAGAQLTHEVRFRIGHVGNIAAKVLTGFWAPDVWMRVGYELNKDGTGVVHISGSLIPSQRRYMADPGKSYIETYFHDMEGNTVHEIRDFLEAGPGRLNDNYFDSIKLQGKRCLSANF